MQVSHSFALVVFQHGTPPLLIAAGCGNIQMLELLIKRGAHIDVQDKVCIVLQKLCSSNLPLNKGRMAVCVEYVSPY